VGGIESVTLSDEEARRRGTQKTVLERRSPPTFDVLIELQERDRLAVHEDVAISVDNLLRGFALQPEIRYRDENDEIHIEKPERRSVASPVGSQGLRRSFPNSYGDGKESRHKNAEINPFEIEEPLTFMLMGLPATALNRQRTGWVCPPRPPVI
jgi:hypothetical protein